MDNNLNRLIRILKILNGLGYCASHGERYQINEIEEEVYLILQDLISMKSDGKLEEVFQFMESMLNKVENENIIADELKKRFLQEAC